MSKTKEKHLLHWIHWILACGWDGCLWLSWSRGQHLSWQTCEVLSHFSRSLSSLHSEGSRKLTWNASLSQRSLRHLGSACRNSMSKEHRNLVVNIQPHVKQLCYKCEVPSSTSEALVTKMEQADWLLIDFNGNCRNIQIKSSSGKTAVQVALIVMWALIVSCM